MLAPFLVQVMAWLVPTSHFSRPVLGAVMVRASLNGEIGIGDIKDRGITDQQNFDPHRGMLMASRAVQAYGEAVGSKPVAITFAGGKVVPSIRRIAQLHVPDTAVFVQVILVPAPTLKVCPPLGAVKVKDPLIEKFASGNVKYSAGIGNQLGNTLTVVPIVSGMGVQV